MEKKHITKYLENGNYCVIVPVFNNVEILPAWRVVFIGTLSECEKESINYPDFIKDNNDGKYIKLLLTEYIFLKDHDNKKELNKLYQRVNKSFLYLFN